jgi:photosystem II stability/assembly factor-like uncharacterized protein
MLTRRALGTLASAALTGGVLTAASLPAQASPPSDTASAAHGPTHAPAAHHTGYDWRITPTGSTEEFRGLAAVDRRTAWVSGEAGTVLRTTDGGAAWQDVSPSAAVGLALRDIEAADATHAVALSIGPGSDSRIYRTTDGGQTWSETFRNADPAAFYDCIAFSKDGTALAMSDPAHGYLQIARSSDAGLTWQVMDTSGMPAAGTNDFGFAASGTCLVSGPGHRFWFATGGDQPRVFSTTDAGQRWSARPVPIRSGDTAGVYSIAFRDARHGVVVGGDFLDETNGADAAAWTADGGRTWKSSSEQVDGYRSGVDFLPRTARGVVAVGPTGSDVSHDGGRTWAHFDNDRYDGVQCSHDGACWASGTDGRVAVLERPRS